ncbi:hypothetical protein H5410_019761 [Solanum commersonii]|uniref:Uncharacterized protein n=1 Tax=Solanum commersonii TaxID=4109 RepID=A0A9J5Z988_SOLCO|nr:hypothetical protein H5410_019761 [Solanum commersonii]
MKLKLCFTKLLTLSYDSALLVASHYNLVAAQLQFDMFAAQNFQVSMLQSNFDQAPDLHLNQLDLHMKLHMYRLLDILGPYLKYQSNHGLNQLELPTTKSTTPTQSNNFNNKTNLFSKLKRVATGLPIADAMDNKGLRAKRFGGSFGRETHAKAFEVSSLGLRLGRGSGSHERLLSRHSRAAAGLPFEEKRRRRIRDLIDDFLNGLKNKERIHCFKIG